MKSVLVGGLLAATAYSADTILYPGTYKIATSGKLGDASTCCYPDANGVTVTQAGGAGTTVNIAWKFDTAANGCNVAAAVEKSISGGAVPASGDVTFTDTVSGLQKSWILDAPTVANGEFTLDLTNVATSAPATAADACKATLVKQLTGTATYPGVYEVTKENGTPASCCYPAGDVIVHQTGGAGTSVSLEWTFDTTAAGCAVAAAQGQTITGSAIPETDGTGDVIITDAVTGLLKDWTLQPAPITSGDFLLDLTNLGSGLDCSVSLTRRVLPTLTYPGVYEVSHANSASCCYPAGDVTVTKDSTTSVVSVAWTFDTCTDATFSGKSISGGAVADTVTGDVTFTDTTTTESWTLNYPVTSTSDWSLDLSSVATGCSATLDKSGFLVGLGSLVALSLSYIAF